MDDSTIDIGVPAQQAIRRILVGTDFSEPAQVALVWAAKLAHHHGATLHLVHAIPPMPLIVGEMPIPHEVMEASVGTATHRLESLTSEWRGEGLAVEGEAQLGSPEAVLLEAIERVGADLVVLGTRGNTGLRRILLGSTARRVVQRATCPVLSIHPEDVVVDLTRPKTLLVPTQLTEDFEQPLEEAMRVFGPLASGTRIVFFYAWHLPISYRHYLDVSLYESKGEEIKRVVRERLASITTRLRASGFEVETVVKRGLTLESIVEQAETSQADLVVMATHGARGLEHLLLGSVAEKTVSLVPCPVLTTHLS